MQTKTFLSALDNERIVRAIREAESRSQGEIRVHVSSQAVGDVQAAAKAVFEKLGMTKTGLRNGVLIYVAPSSQKFAVLGDQGIHERCGTGFWTDVAGSMEVDFRAGRFTDGLVKGVARAGEALATHFPRPEGAAETNELPDDVTED
jgi:uncharacterized membrane protein